MLKIMIMIHFFVFKLDVFGKVYNYRETRILITTIIMIMLKNKFKLSLC